MHNGRGTTEMSGSVRENGFVLYTYQHITEILAAVNASSGGVIAPSWGDCYDCSAFAEPKQEQKLDF